MVACFSVFARKQKGVWSSVNPFIAVLKLAPVFGKLYSMTKGYRAGVSNYFGHRDTY